MSLFLASPPRSIIIPELWLKSTIDGKQIDDKDAAIYKLMMKLSKKREYNGDEPSSIVSTEDLKQEK